jgi:tRNA G18 (ribose-2'-O)-methylase SpoU
MTKKNIFIILHNIRSAQNVGSIFRTADACGISKIFLTGYTPSPMDTFGRVQGKIAKTALGAEKSMPWEYKRTPSSIISKLKEDNVEIICVEQSKNSVDYKKLKIKKDTAFIFGNEVLGVSLQLQKKCEKISFIPMKGEKESLNVAVSVGVFLYRVLGI